jgi:hypothetical protein
VLRKLSAEGLVQHHTTGWDPRRIGQQSGGPVLMQVWSRCEDWRAVGSW